MIVKSFDGNCVYHSNVLSKCLTTNTGAPQGAVLSPILFTAYTNDCQFNSSSLTKMIKFADDTTIQGLISKDGKEDEYRDNINWFVKWCKEHFLLLNVDKTKEVIIDFRKKKSALLPIFINNQEVKRVDSYKYLGVTIDSELNWKAHSNNIFKKLNSRMYFLRKINYFRVNSKILELFYKSFLESLISFALTCWGGNVRMNNKERINQIIKKANKIISKTSHSPSNICDFDSLYHVNCQKKILSIIKDQSHPLSGEILFSSRSGRPLTIKSNKNRYKNSFLPHALKLL